MTKIQARWRIVGTAALQDEPVKHPSASIIPFSAIQAQASVEPAPQPGSRLSAWARTLFSEARYGIMADWHTHASKASRILTAKAVSGVSVFALVLIMFGA